MTSAAAKFTASRPEAQKRLICTPGTPSPNPAVSAAARAMSPPASPTGSTQPSTTSSTTEGSARLRALIAPSAWVASESAVTSCSEPSALPRPRGVRTASYTNASVILFLLFAALEAARDEKLHDLVGPGIDALHPRVAVHARDRIFVHIAIAAEQLQAAVDDFVLQVGQPVLGHRGRDGIELPPQVALHAVVMEDAADGRLGFALGELELGVLEVDDLLAEGLPLLDVVDGEP